MRKSMLKISAVVLSVMILSAPVAYAVQWNPLKGAKEELKKRGTKVLDGVKTGGKDALDGAIKGTDTGNVNGGKNNGGVGRVVGNGTTDDATSGLSYRRDTNGASTERKTASKPDSIAVPESLRGVNVGNTHSAYDNVHNFYEEVKPQETSSTVHVVLENLPKIFTDFHDGIAYVNTGDAAFFINERGEKLCDSYMAGIVSVDDSPRFHNGVVLERPVGFGAPIKKVVLRDKSGNVVKEFEAKQCSNFANGVAMVAVETPNTKGTSVTVKYIDTKGNFVFPGLDAYGKTGAWGTGDLHKYMREEHEGLIAFPAFDAEKREIGWGFRDSNGNVIVKPQYSEVGDFHDGVAMFKSGTSGKWGFIDKSGREVIPPSFSKKPSEFNSGLARVETKDDQAYIIDKNGKKVKGPFYYREGGGHQAGDLISITPFFNGYAVMGISTLMGENEYGPEHEVEYCAVDPSFNVRSWTDREINNGQITADGDKLYFTCPAWNGDVAGLDIKSLDLLTPRLPRRPVNGYSRYNGYSSKGYVNDNMEYVIKFEVNEF